MAQAQQIKLTSSNLLIQSIQINRLISNEMEDSEVAASSEELDVEEDDG
jgi:hypothetical protein